MHELQLLCLAMTATASRNATARSSADKLWHASRVRAGGVGCGHGIALVHVGKAGGSSVSKNLRRGCHAWWAERYNNGVCPAAAREMANESEISKRVLAYWHVHPVPVERYAEFIVMVRNPIERIISIFLATRPPASILKQSRSQASTLNRSGLSELLGSRKPKGPPRNALLAFQRAFYSCFQTTNEFAEGSTSNPAMSTHPNPNCAELGWRTLRGEIQLGPTHFYFNFGFYARPILAFPTVGIGNCTAKKIYVIRTEAIWQDWQQINAMLGGGRAPVPSTHERDGQQSFSHEYNRTVSERGLVNLCAGLAAEREVYTELIQQAANLGPWEKQLELIALAAMCRGTTSYLIENLY